MKLMKVLPTQSDKENLIGFAIKQKYLILVESDTIGCLFQLESCEKTRWYFTSALHVKYQYWLHDLNVDGDDFVKAVHALKERFRNYLNAHSTWVYALMSECKNVEIVE